MSLSRSNISPLVMLLISISSIIVVRRLNSGRRCGDEPDCESITALHSGGVTLQSTLNNVAASSQDWAADAATGV